MKGLLEDMFDLDLGSASGHDSPDEILRRAQTQFQEKQALDEAERQAREERRAQRKKSAGQAQKEERAAADARQISQSIREIHRKLASALHPDRETDPQERVRKTALMQRINQAYDKRNLLQLLELQLELEHIDGNVIGSVDEERLRHYNIILKEQIAELKDELMRVEFSFCAQFGMDPFARATPETVLRDLGRRDRSHTAGQPRAGEGCARGVQHAGHQGLAEGASSRTGRRRLLRFAILIAMAPSSNVTPP